MARPSFRRLEELFHRAVELPAGERAQFLDRECAGEPELRSAVEDMLRHDELDATEDGALASPVAGFASKLRHEAPTLDAAPAEPFKQPAAGLPQIPGYELLEELGRGGMGVVYKARQIGLNRLVALKTLLPFAVPTSEQLARFRSEAEALARLSHPNVVPIFEVGECAAGPYFSMEYVPGPNLADLLDGRPCEPMTAARFVETMARAIAAVHRQGIVHRDLKPGNILLCPTKETSETRSTRHGNRPALADYEPKITDFGIAKNQSARQALTRTGTALGTPCYMAPEQASGKAKKVGPTADLYSLGAILYEMLTGRPPFEETTPLATIACLVNEDPPPPSRLRPGLPRDLITICLKCLEKSPRARYANATELADELRRFRHHEPILARAIGPAGKLYRWARRRPLVAALAALCTVLVIAFVITVSIYDVMLQEALEREKNNAEFERQEIVKLNITIGLSDLDDGDSFSAVLRFTEALRRDKGHPERNHRIRIGTALEQSPKLVQLWIPSRKILCSQATGRGARVATIDSLRNVEIWDSARGRLNGLSLPHDCEVVLGAFSPDGMSLATVTADGKTRLWSLRDGSSRALRIEEGPLVRALAFQSDGRLTLVRGEQAVVEVCDPTRQTPATRSVGPMAGGSERLLSEDGRRLLTFGDRGSARLWDVATGKPIGGPLKLPADGRPVFSRDGRRVGVVENAATLHVADGDTGEWLSPPLRCPFAITTLAFSPAGDKVLTAGRGEAALIWRMTGGEPVCTVTAAHGDIRFARFSSDGLLLVTGDSIGGARIWNAVTGRPLSPPLRHGGTPREAAFSADNQHLLTVGSTGVLCVWRLPEHPRQGASRAATTADVDAAPAAPLTDGQRRLLERDVAHSRVIYSMPNHVQVCDGSSDQPISPPLLHSSPVRFAAFSRDGSLVCTADADRRIRVWDIATGERLSSAQRLPAAIVSIDSATETVRCVDGSMLDWHMYDNSETPEKLAELASVLAASWIDNGRQQQVLDPVSLEARWQTLREHRVEQ